jgi:hypothetical protein
MTGAHAFFPCGKLHPVVKLPCNKPADHVQPGPSFERYHRASRPNQLRPNATDVWLWHDHLTVKVLEAMRAEYEMLGAYKEPEGEDG